MSETIILESIIEQLRKENSELKQSQSQKQKIKMYDKIQELEQQKAELIEFVKIVERYFGPYTNAGISRGGLYNLSCELLQKHEVKT